MSFLTGKSSKVLVGQYDLSAYFNTTSTAITSAENDTTTYGNDWKTKIGGLLDGSANGAGLFDSTAGAIDPVISALIGDDTGSPVTIGIGGGAIGDRCRLLKGKVKGHPIDTPVDGIVGVNVDWAVDGGVDGGDILKNLAAATQSTNYTSVNNGSATYNGGIGHLHISAASGTGPTLTGVVAHSSDNISFASLATFTQATQAGSERISVAADTTVNQYLRLQTTVAGTTPSFTHFVAFARR